MHMGYMGHFYY